MKKTVLLFSSLFLLTAVQAQVANSNVENWRNYSAGFPPTALETPVDWFGADSIIYTYAPLLSSTPQQTLFKDNDAHGGSYAVKLISADFSGVVVPGLLANANPELDFQNLDMSNILNSVSYIGGTAVNQRYLQMTAWIKYIPVGTDLGIAEVQALLSGQGAGGNDSVVGGGVLYLQAAAGYTEITVPVTYKNATVVPDKLLITFLSSDLTGENAATPANGSTLYIDDISLSTVANVKDIYAQAEISNVYPNPANDVLTVKADNNNQLAVNIYNCNGALMSSQVFKNTTSFQLNSFASGLYFYEIKDAKEKKVQRGSFSVIK